MRKKSATKGQNGKEAKKVTAMPALCVAQPWASCIFENGKNVENASTNLRKRGTIAIYASRSKKMSRFDDCKKDYNVKKTWDQVPKGAILGFVDIVGVIEKPRQITRNTKKWYQRGLYGYILKNPYILKKPVATKPPNGAIKFWTLKGKALRQALEHVPKKRRAQFIEWARDKF